MSQHDKPEMVIVCGPNGAGKTTLTCSERIRGTERLPFVDPDRIAKEQGFTPLQAGKVVCRAVKAYVENSRSFVRESTLTARFDFQMIDEAKKKGFQVNLVYVGLDSAEKAVLRVEQRHAQGGHTVPIEDITRRYERSLANLPEAISKVDSARVFDNSGLHYKAVAEFEKGKIVSLAKEVPEWFKKPLAKIQEQTHTPQKKQDHERER